MEPEVKVEAKAEEGFEFTDAPAAAPEVQAPTLEELAKEGFQGEELKAAKELGLATDKKEGVEPKTELKKEGEQKDKIEDKKEVKTESKKPTDADYQAAWDRAQIEQDPVKEAEKTKDWSLNEKQLYKAQKIAWHAKKVAEAEKAQIESKSSAKVRAAEEKAKRLEEKLKAVDPDYVDDGKEDAPEDKYAAEEKKRDEAAQVAAARSQAHEEEARAHYSDFDEVVALTKDIFQSQGKMFKDNPKLFTKASMLARQFYQLYGQPIQPGQYSAADVAYEIGLLHPNYKKADASTAQVETDGTATKAETQKLDPKKVDRVKENSKRPSSASLPTGGGAKRVVSYEDMTTEQFLSLTDEQLAKVPQHIVRKHAGG